MRVKERVIDFINSFLSSNDNYGELIEIEENVKEIYDFIKDYIFEKGSDLSVLKVKDRVFLSKPRIEFEEVYKVLKKHCTLSKKKGITEIWDDKENKLLNVIVSAVRKHFLISYKSLEERDDLISSITL